MTATTQGCHGNGNPRSGHVIPDVQTCSRLFLTGHLAVPGPEGAPDPTDGSQVSSHRWWHSCFIQLELHHSRLQSGPLLSLLFPGIPGLQGQNPAGFCDQPGENPPPLPRRKKNVDRSRPRRSGFPHPALLKGNTLGSPPGGVPGHLENRTVAKGWKGCLSLQDINKVPK